MPQIFGALRDLWIDSVPTCDFEFVKLPEAVSKGLGRRRFTEVVLYLLDSPAKIPLTKSPVQILFYFDLDNKKGTILAPYIKFFRLTSVNSGIFESKNM